MLVEVAGVNTWNKGAELMLVAVRERFLRAHPDVRFAVDQHFGTAADRGRYDLGLRYEPNGIRSRLWVRGAPPSLRGALDLVREADVDVVLDASGFAFGDQLPKRRIEEFQRAVERWAGQGKRIILLPQALGPFENPPHRDAFRQIAASVHLVYARDPISLGHARGAAGDVGEVRQAPDFTIAIKPAPDPLLSAKVVIVPNQRMVDEAPSKATAAEYVPFLRSVAESVSARGLEVAILLHGSMDAELAETLQAHLEPRPEIVSSADPVKLKSLLGGARLVVASRFHALVGALSMGTPAVATSWSHKYEGLMTEFGCPEMLLPVPCPTADLEDCLDRALGPEAGLLAGRIRSAGARLEEQTEAMWAHVDAVMGLSTA